MRAIEWKPGYFEAFVLYKSFVCEMKYKDNTFAGVSYFLGAAATKNLLHLPSASIKRNGGDVSLL
jgi:hypothetical protein